MEQHHGFVVGMAPGHVGLAWGWPLTRGDGHPHVGMAAHAWGWRKPLGDGHPEAGDGHSHLWGWPPRSWGRPPTPGNGRQNAGMGGGVLSVWALQTETPRQGRDKEGEPSFCVFVRFIRLFALAKMSDFALKLKKRKPQQQQPTQVH